VRLWVKFPDAPYDYLKSIKDKSRKYPSCSAHLKRRGISRAGKEEREPGRETISQTLALSEISPLQERVRFGIALYSDELGRPLK
jgi:hypothetical protein